MIDCFFNRPNQSIGIESVLQDVRGATTRLALVSAWFTDTEIAREFIDSHARQKYVLLNQADLNRDRSNSKAVKLIRDYSISDPMVRIRVLGSDDFREGVMHHKFILVDSDIVWCGSYNFTFQARHNYETLLRIVDEGVARKFWSETLDLSWNCDIDGVRENKALGILPTFKRCDYCKTLKPASELLQWGSNLYACQACQTRIGQEERTRGLCELSNWTKDELIELDAIREAAEEDDLETSMKRALRLYDRVLGRGNNLLLQTALRFIEPTNFSSTEILIGLGTKNEVARSTVEEHLDVLRDDFSLMLDCEINLMVYDGHNV